MQQVVLGNIFFGFLSGVCHAYAIAGFTSRIIIRLAVHPKYKVAEKQQHNRPQTTCHHRYSGVQSNIIHDKYAFWLQR